MANGGVVAKEIKLEYIYSYVIQRQRQPLR